MQRSIIPDLAKFVENCNRSQKEAAVKLGISPQYISALLSGKRVFTSELAAKLGYEKVIMWQPIKRQRK